MRSVFDVKRPPILSNYVVQDETQNSQILFNSPELTINKDSNYVSFIKETNVPEYFDSIKAPEINRIKDNIVLINGDYYFYKDINPQHMINELIGSYLSAYLGIPAVNYQIGLNNGVLYALSKLFYKPNHIYQSCNDVFGKVAYLEADIRQNINEETIYSQTAMLSLINNKEMIRKILKLTALDLKMDQVDRHDGNIMIEIYKTIINLAPLYDFSYSYFDSRIFMYSNPFVIVNRNQKSIENLALKYPEIVPFLNQLGNLPISDVIREIEQANHITIGDDIKHEYQQKDEEYSRKLIL